MTPLHGARRDVGRSMRAAATTACALALLGAGVAAAQAGATWTQFQGGPGKNGAVSGGPEPGFRQAWRTPIAPGGPDARFGLSAPVIAGDIAIAVGPEQVFGLEVSTGEQAFSVPRDLGPPVAAAIADVAAGPLVVYTEGWGDGPPDAPAVAGEPATEELSPSAEPASDAGDGPATSYLAAFDLATQERAWKPVALDAVSRTGVTVDGDRAFVGANGGIVTAVDLTDGTVAWTATLEAPLVTSIAVVDAQVLVSLQGDDDSSPVIVSLDAASGEERWRYEPAVASAVVSAASSDGEGVFAIFTGLSETTVVALDAIDGAERWSTRVNAAFDVIAPPIVSSEAIVVVDPIGHVRALDPASGEQRWDFALNSTTVGSVPAVVGSFLLVPTLDGELGAIATDTGELVWRSPADGAPIRAMAVAPDRLIVVRARGLNGVEAYEHDPGVTLVSEASPTTLSIGAMLGSMALALVAVLTVAGLLGRLLGARMGTAIVGDVGDDDPNDEPIRDPWEDGDEDPPS